MAETILIDHQLSGKEKYQALLPQLKALVQGEIDLVANLGNILSALHYTFGFHWTGCYLVRGNELVLGPFQGPVACTRIAFGKGVCGMAWKENRTLNVPDVDAFPGHIACSALSRSELVLPVHGPDGGVVAVIDIDSEIPARFRAEDEAMLEEVIRLIEALPGW
ncbi:MAG: GAF domain-containing protein [Flavobacteriales bacterium]|jgi:L-methionine (R)-S-oxide reductase